MNKLSLVAVAVAISISGCGGGGSGTPAVTVLDGVFKDSNVQNLNYVSGNQKGATNKSGEFKYEEGSQVAFSVGAIDLGSALGKAIVSPVDLVANGNLASDAVINRVRFLMMLDKNNTPSDGIEISTKIQKAAEEWDAINFSANADDFESELNSKSIMAKATLADDVLHTLPDKDTAVAHLRTTLLCSYAGGFNGSYSGTEAGNVAFIVDPATGNLSGSSYNSTNQVSVEVNSTSPINYDTDLGFVSAENSGKEFSGNFTSTDELSGAWVNSVTPAEKGNFMAARVGGASDAVYRYAANYVGSNNDSRGLFAFDVDSASRITGRAYDVISGELLNITGSVKNGEFENTKLSDGTKISGFLGEGELNGSSRTENGDIANFAGSGCKLN